MTITINDVKRSVPDDIRLSDLGVFAYTEKYIDNDPAMCISAVNNQLYLEEEFVDIIIKEGDEIDFIPIMVGG